MSEKSRNFRSSYYDKVGFRGVEEKKSLEILINEKPMDKAKLSKFCMRFALPSMYREYVWKVLLGVLPVNAESHESVMDQKMRHYHDLQSSLRVMHKIQIDTPKPISHCLMYFMTKELLLFNLQHQLESSHAKNLIALATVFLKLCAEEVAAFWLFKNFVLFQRKSDIQFSHLKEKLEGILLKEDPQLHLHLNKVNALQVIPVVMWFQRCFAEVLTQTSLARVLDKVIGGSCKILPYVGASILLVRRHLILDLEDSDQILPLLEKIPEDTSDVVVTKALDLFYSV